MYGGTDASAIRLTKSGIPATTIGIPRRYSHSPVEMLNIEDLSNLIQIVTKSIERLDHNFNLHRI
jgi:endoglucanase